MAIAITLISGWTDTPGVEKSIPGFYNAMKSQLRTVEQGADTMVWLAIANDADAKAAMDAGRGVHVHTFI